MSPAGKRRFSVTLTKPFMTALEKLVDKGLYIDNQDALRHALRQLFRYHGIDMASFNQGWGKVSNEP